MGPRSIEGKAERKFADSIGTLNDFNAATFAYLFGQEDTGIQVRGMEIFRAMIKNWANKEINEGMTDEMVNLIFTARRIEDSLTIYQN